MFKRPRNEGSDALSQRHSGLRLAGLTLTLFSTGVGGCVLEPTEPATDQDRLVDGQVTQGDRAVAAMVIASGGNQSLCTGTLVADRALLFAAHCVQPNIESVDVYFGADLFAFAEGDDPTFIANTRAVEVRVHPDWTGNAEQGNDFAIALLEDSPPINPVPLNIDPPEYLSSDVRLVGFGHDTVEVENGELSFSGQGLKRTGFAFLADVTNDFVAVDSTGDNAGACPGDSGGPTFALAGGLEVLIGVTSFSDFPPDRLDLRCDAISVQARVDTHLDFIIEAIDVPPGAAIDAQIFDL